MIEMTYDAYVDAINAKAVAFGWCAEGDDYCDREAWRDSYKDGLTVNEAWAEEVDAANSMLG